MWHELKLLAVVVAVVVCFMGGFLFLKAALKSPPQHIRIELLVEDDPDWDCHTMGNKVCGL
jgi:hypothetical protein